MIKDLIHKFETQYQKDSIGESFDLDNDVTIEFNLDETSFYKENEEQNTILKNVIVTIYTPTTEYRIWKDEYFIIDVFEIDNSKIVNIHLPVFSVDSLFNLINVLKLQ